MTLATNRQLGFVAALLTVLGSFYSLLSYVGTNFVFTSAPDSGIGVSLLLAVLGFIGFILFLVAMYGFSRDYLDSAIFNNIIYGIVATIILAVVIIGIVVFFLLVNIGSLASSFEPPLSATDVLGSFGGYLSLITLVSSFIGLIPAYFNMRAFNRLAARSGVRLFRIVGLLGVAAAALTIALGSLGITLFYASTFTFTNILSVTTISSAVSLVAWCLAAVAFYSMRVPAVGSSWTPVTPVSPAAQAKKCPYREPAS
jgi:uncharacterized membrane protein